MTTGRALLGSTSRALRLCAVLAAASVAPALGLARQTAPNAPRRPNVVLLMADQHRGDALGCNGNTAIKTPNLDRLAREGATFTRAYSSTPSCTPARAALLTGMSPWGHGMLGYSRVAEEYPVELPRALRDAGYWCHVVGKNHFDPQRLAHGYHELELDESGRVLGKGFVSDYRQWFAREAPGLDPDALGIGWNDYRAGTYPHPERLHPTAWTGERAVRFITEYAREEPFFLKVSFERPHSPYDPPARVLSEYEDAEIPAPFVGEWSEEANGARVKPNAHTAPRNNLGSAVTLDSRRHYYANVTFVDEEIGCVLAALEETGRLADTVVLFTSDHGDMLGDHHLWRKTYAYEGSARIPMVLWWGANVAGLADVPRGQGPSEPVELRDVLPTFLDAAGLPVPEIVEGRSLFDLLRGAGEPWREVLDLEHSQIYWPENAWTALTDGHTKYVYFARDGAQQLFDLDADPGETVDLARDPAQAERLAEWRGRMAAHLAPRGAPWVVDGDLGIREKAILLGPNYPRASHSETVPLTREMLRVLPDGGEGLLQEWLLERAKEQFDARRAELADALASVESARAYVQGLRAGYDAMLGEMPARTPLEPVVTGVLERDGYRIEKVYYASRPRHHVTANLYVPTTSAGPFPAVLVACGHAAEGKAYPAYQSVAASLALNGFVALVYDPIGQGERHQLDGPDHGTTEHERLAHGALLVGDSVVKHEAWDGVRSLDYLLSRPEVDASLPVGMTGNSGGGTQTAFLMALDSRIAVAAPSCYLMSRERLFETIGPQDACQHLYGEGALGIEHADYVMMRAPKPTLILAAERDFFEFDATRQAFDEARALYERVGAPERVALFAADDEHGFSKPRREAAVQWMRRWILDDPAPVTEPELALATEDELRVTTTGQVRTAFADELTLADMSLARALELEAGREAFWASHSREECLAEVRRLLALEPERGPVRARSFGAVRRAAFTVEKLGLERAGAPIVPALFFQPDEPAADEPVVLYVDGRGKEADVSPGAPIRELVAAGRYVLSIDARGFGETADRTSDAKFHDADQRVAALSLHIGRPLLGQRVDDVLSAVDYLTQRERPVSPTVELRTVGAAAPVGMHAMPLDPRIQSHWGHRSNPVSWIEDVVERPSAPDVAASVVPSALLSYDLPDLLPTRERDNEPRPSKPHGPNVVLVMTDDQGWGDFGFQGNPVIRTPNLDALASSSARLATFYVSPVCAPTRAALMTGRYCQRTRAIDTYIGRAMMEPAEVTVAEVLQRAGWATGIFGKWHLGDCYPMRAMDQGFDESLVLRGGGIGQPSDPEGGEAKYTDAILFHNGVETRTSGYCTDVYFDAALEWMRAEHAAGRPFFTYIATNAPHGPFGDVPAAEYASVSARDLSSTAFPRTEGHPLPAEHDEDRLARIFAMIENIDANMGRLMAGLEAMGAAENTLVLFLVDNGPNTRRWVGGMRGMKTEVYEGGIRSPLLAHWPGHLPAHTVPDVVGAHVDVMPTILEACGLAPPRGVELDGRSLLAPLRDDTLFWPDRTITIQAHRGNEAVRYHNFMARTQRWKLVNASGFHEERESVEPRFELYDMQADPLELADVAAEHPGVVARMREEYDAWFDDVSSTRPDNYAPPRIVIGSSAAPEVVLTRQDWRRTSEERGSFGHWEVRVQSEGPYRVRVRYPRGAKVRSVTLRLGRFEQTEASTPDAREHTFESVRLPLGPRSVEVALAGEDGPLGAYQVFFAR